MAHVTQFTVNLDVTQVGLSLHLFFNRGPS